MMTLIVAYIIGVITGMLVLGFTLMLLSIGDD